MLRRFLSLLLCLVFFTASMHVLPAGAEEAAPSIRVLLRRLALTDRIDLSLSGAYSLSWGKNSRMLFPAGSKLTVQVRQDQLILFFSGASLNCGAKLLLARVASDSAEKASRTALLSHGLRIAPGDALYLGDLALTVSGGQLQPVLSISVEDYLLGVVPYEMSDDFPLEALKAQAVCARTYALGRVDPKKAWDVVDTTNDQVFRGLTGGHSRSAEAVAATAGLVGYSGGALAHCYYSASNGGQTELPSHVWAGEESSRCFATVDDPYDVENPESIVKKASFRKDASGLPEPLLEMIIPTILAQPQMADYVQQPDCLRLDAVTEVSLSNPRFRSPSRLMTKLNLTLQVSGRRLLAPVTPDPLTYEPEEDLVSPLPLETPSSGPVLSSFTPVGTFTLSLDLFPALIRVLGLSIYGADNEIITVSEETDRFVLTAGRYGHGVGMSQRGAQWMAARYKKNFQQILSFYFPGMVLKKAASGAAQLSTPDPLLAETPGPAATPTPRPTLMPVSEASLNDLPEGAWLASVENIEDDSSLNLRADPSPAGEILMRLYKHQRLVVLETCEDPVWVHVRTDAVEGYVMVSFLEKAE
ncbi:MAG: SpoIID/LytB domain-containing protein [Clostridia bacterium]|nr:SpoIID/LytB domain-containing protein [Clostridia bacterium]